MHENLQEGKKKSFDKIIVPKVPDRDVETLISFMILLLHLKQALRSWNGSIFLKRTPFFHHHPLKEKKKKMMAGEKLQVKRCDLYTSVKVASNQFLTAELSTQEEKEELSEGRIRSLKSLVGTNTKISDTFLKGSQNFYWKRS